ncbi:MAG: C-GCAxxG-C-C family protein [Propionibacteriaceae bacterium]|jgi:C_GCAxxG_C_C family probable redox protein|nr:C-GCAxxG-C-C family protein [Propionibacteriaceae bacterium]
MLKDRIRGYFLDQDYNCAETMARAASAEYGLELDSQALALLSGFGFGLGCKRTCGALCGGLAALSALTVNGRAHNTPGFNEQNAAYVARFEEQLGSIQCDELMARYRTPEERCLHTVELAADVLESFIADRQISAS